MLGLLLLLLIGGLAWSLSPDFDPLAAWQSIVARDAIPVVAAIRFAFVAWLVFIVVQRLRYWRFGRHTVARRRPR